MTSPKCLRCRQRGINSLRHTDRWIGLRLFPFFVYLSLSTSRSQSCYEPGRSNEDEGRRFLVAVQITSGAFSFALCKVNRHFSFSNTYVLRSNRNGANKFRFQNKRHRRFPFVPQGNRKHETPRRKLLDSLFSTADRSRPR